MMNSEYRKETIELTPQMAKDFLSNMAENQRKLQPCRVVSISRDISNGRWVHTGDSIRINAEGRMCDGQHRCSAVVKSNKSVTTDICYGVSSDAMKYIDNQKSRNFSDYLKVNGFGSIDSGALTSALRLLWLTHGDMNPSRALGKDIAPTMHELSELLEYNPGIETSLRVCNTNKTSKVMSRAFAAWLHYVVKDKNPDSCADFFEGINTGVGLGELSPMLTLRDRMFYNARCNTRLSRRSKMALCIKAWNSHVSGRFPKAIRWNEGVDAFPVVVGLTKPAYPTVVYVSKDGDLSLAV